MNKAVWIVDDDKDVRDVLRTMLKILGFECREFEDARTPAHALMVEEMPALMMLVSL